MTAFRPLSLTAVRPASRQTSSNARQLEASILGFSIRVEQRQATAQRGILPATWRCRRRVCKVSIWLRIVGEYATICSSNESFFSVMYRSLAFSVLFSARSKDTHIKRRAVQQHYKCWLCDNNSLSVASLGGPQLPLWLIFFPYFSVAPLHGCPGLPPPPGFSLSEDLDTSLLIIVSHWLVLSFTVLVFCLSVLLRFVYHLFFVKIFI